MMDRGLLLAPMYTPVLTQHPEQFNSWRLRAVYDWVLPDWLRLEKETEGSERGGVLCFASPHPTQVFNIPPVFCLIQFESMNAIMLATLTPDTKS